MTKSNGPIRAAIIGAGHFAYRMHIPILAQREEVVLDSVCRLGRKELDLIADEFGFAFATEDWREMLSRDIDIAVIASPHNLHYEQAKAFLEKGCHVLVEKPMCLDPDQAWDLVHVAQATGRELLVAYGWNYKPGLDAMRDMVAEIGEIEHVVCHMASFTRGIFSGGGMERWAHIAIQPDRSTWEAPDQGGGYAYGQLSHALGILYWLTDLRCASVRSTLFQAPSTIDLHDAATVRFQNGATGVLSGSCGVPNGHGFEVDLRIYGTKGSVLLDIETERLVLKLPGGETRVAKVPQGAWTYSCEGPANRLVDIALGLGRNESPGEVGARAVETLHAIVASGQANGAEQIINQTQKAAAE
ncbi:Gfo/Idh/MocA family protein [Mameliella sediminis]|uniref:Gfo/Idh/MocA family protein n=1 Tax=Mameliella sediminis TaxID=2836866 RepID=UPI001C480B07|nr:Gfo/Idh/MocA family oxidoreductase [Mameliella sediminis]MBV7396862.1 Gfo/Idh/MocA family oxidoreductase [Mameliella sediminis]MBY6116180.1 Gfo/Idh/MocA family oxidoreductase [Antarctobacter heliothermus]MBY6146145.1 Gfo/Idh/MocA family oxidoreductase [Mameliella alba]MCA0955330.1 Gfo/Idh/MocA family oxidoreductase [Mameliella alba]